MKLNSEGVIISIIILIFMMLICHTMNYLYPKNKFENIAGSNTKIKPINYNEIYYNKQNEKVSCDNSNNLLGQAEIPCDAIKTCESQTLSDSELAVIYKVAYETAAREIFIRTLDDIKNKKYIEEKI